MELLRDGDWRVVKDECEMLSDSDNEASSVAPKATPKPAQPVIAHAKKPESKQEPEIVTLSDSEVWILLNL